MDQKIGFIVGILVGCGGLLLAQLVTKRPQPDPAESPEKVEKSLFERTQGDELAKARKKIEKLEADLELAVAKSGDGKWTSTDQIAGEGEEKEDPEKGAAKFIEMMMAMGDQGAERKIDKEVTRLAGIMNLSDDQQAVLRQALLDKHAAGKAGGLKFITGKATIEDLMAADEHNFTAVDEALAAVLGEDQLDAFAEVQEQREVERIQTKTEEELGELMKATDLSDDQQEAAWEVLADINAEERPGEFPEGATTDDFVVFLDEAIEKRVSGLTPILDGEQLDTYRNQTAEFRKMVTTAVGYATGEELE